MSVCLTTKAKLSHMGALWSKTTSAHLSDIHVGDMTSDMSSRYDIYIYIYIYIYISGQRPSALSFTAFGQNVHGLWPEYSRHFAFGQNRLSLWLFLYYSYIEKILHINYVLWLKVGPGGAHQCCFFSGLMTSPLLFLQKREAHNEPVSYTHLTLPTILLV